MKHGNAIHVLVVDHDANFLTETCGFLRQHGLTVALTDRPAEILEFLRRGKVEVVLLNVDMPRLDGYHVLRQIKQRHPSVQVIVFGGPPLLECRKRSLRLVGALDCVDKPLDLKDILGKIRDASVMNRWQATQNRSADSKRRDCWPTVVFDRGYVEVE